MKVAVAASYYKFTSKGEDIIEIDVLNRVEKVDGKDRLAEHRKANALKVLVMGNRSFALYSQRFPE